MRHLKRFNENVSDYYQLIDKLEFIEATGDTFNADDRDDIENINKTIDVEQKNIDIIKKNLKSEYVVMEFRGVLDGCKFITIGRIVTSTRNRVRLNNCYVYQCDDEWMYVEWTNYNNNVEAYYKCDQIEGLLTLLSDKGLTKKQKNESYILESNEFFYSIPTVEFYFRGNEIDSQIQFLSVNNNDLEFTTSDKLKIRSMVDVGFSYFLDTSNKSVRIKMSKNGKELRENIYKSDDEWFFVVESYRLLDRNIQRQVRYAPQIESELVYESYYKCDQIDGLIEFLNSRRDYFNSHL